MRPNVAAIDAWSTPQRASAAGALVAALVLLSLALHVLNPWIRATALFVDVVAMQSEVRPLTWVTPDPRRHTLTWGEDGRGELILPAGSRPAPALVLALGARPAGADDPRVLRITDALARVGFAVLLPLSEPLHRGEVTPAEVDRLVEAVRAAGDHPRTHPDGILLIGLSVGGSLSLLAAADERLESRLGAVLAFGAYYDARDILAAAASGSVRTPEGDVRTWQPNRTTRWVLAASLRTVPVEGDPEAAAAVAQLLAAIEEGDVPISLEAAEAAVGRLGDTQHEWFDGISPAGKLDQVAPPWFVIHDYGDELIPYEESERIARERAPDLDVRTNLFDHVTPDLADFGTLLRDGGRLIHAFARLIAHSR